MSKRKSPPENLKNLSSHLPGGTSVWRQVLQLGADLLEIGRSSRPIYELLQAQRRLLLDTAVSLFNAETGLWIAAELFNFLPGLTTLDKDQKRELLGELTPLMQTAYDTRRLCCSGLSQAAAASGIECAPEDAAPESAAVPLLVEDPNTHRQDVLGVLQVTRPPEAPFSAQDLELLDGIGMQASIAFQASLQAALEQWRIEQLSLVRQVSAQVAYVRDLDELSRQVTRLILDTFDYYYVAIFTLEPGEDRLTFRASAGPGRSRVDAEPAAQSQIPAVLSIKLGEGLIGHVALTGEEVIANDVSQDPHYRYSDALPETQSEVALPLKIEDRVVGVLDVQSDQRNDFYETDMMVLRALAGNIATAVEGTRLFSDLRSRAEQLAMLREVGNAISSILDLETLLQEVVNLIHDRLGYPYVHLFSVHQMRRKIIYQAGSGPRSQAFREQGYSYDLDDPHGLIPWAARTGETIVANDVDQEPRYRPSPLPPRETRSELTVPLVFGGNVLGVLDLQSDRYNAFGEETVAFFEALADQVAIAMRNANLYRSELWRRQVAESMREVAGLLSADVDLDHVLNAILTELDRALSYDVAVIWLCDEESQLDGLEDGETYSLAGERRPVLRLAAVHGLNPAEFGLHFGVSLDDILRRLWPVEDGGDGADASGEEHAGWLLEALNNDSPLVRTPDSAWEPIGSLMGFPSDYSAIAAPLRVGDQRLGILELIDSNSGRYGGEARSMTAAFASYAAVAIENTRLYEAAHEQAWVSTVLLQVSDATQSLTDLNELLATVVRITPMLVGVQACALYILDENDVFVPAAAYGFSPEQQAEFERWRFAPGDVAVLDQIFINKEPVILQGKLEDRGLASILEAGQESESGLETQEDRLIVLMPLVSRGEILGAMLVDYNMGDTSDGGLGGQEAFLDERLSIIQGVAHQTATAVENIRLFKAQREEAYVSVALLQVAQAVVSSNSLEETLSAIVRITPILVGVKRSLIFLWDEDEGVFRLAEAYGIPRETGEITFTPAEFPLLDAARKWDTLMAYPIDGLDSEEEEAPYAWAHLPAPDLDEVEELIENTPYLLLAFPLSVKGKVLGVLLVEEPDPMSVEGYGPGSGWRRLREKRLEITRGISQQAAMAIQNDQLQREMVERERLEREFQLAREIQRTFLPHEIPQLQGWDMDIRWRTAREVGGDFYDFFTLPGNRLGIVTADVADKGMPAALFMVLVRTLVRATVSDIESPAAVLERVNVVLVPDAQQGMFVTIVYAVLDLESGELVYANAGHNPPLLYRSATGSLEKLERGGMALGVMEHNPIQEHRLQVDPGDILVLYTDGITEAFSPHGDMLGDAKLREVLLTAGQQIHNSRTGGRPAGQMLDAIEQSLLIFTEGGSRADDLTLLAIARLAADFSAQDHPAGLPSPDDIPQDQPD